MKSDWASYRAVEKTPPTPSPFVLALSSRHVKESVTLIPA